MASATNRTVQTWTKRIKMEHHWNIYEEQANLVNRSQNQFLEKHKLHLLEFFDGKLYTTTEEALDSSIRAFECVILKRTTMNTSS
jgi:hypothetical protein